MKKILTLISLLIFLMASISAQSITGKVVDAKNETLPGVAVIIKGTSEGTSTDIDGNYSIKVPNSQTVLVFQLVGHNNMEISVGSQKVINVTLVEDDKTLGEVVVVGYGTSRKKDLTGSVASIASKDFNQGSVISAEQLINGKVAGVQITSPSGAPGAGGRIRIRGTNSISGGSDPLYVIDGIPIDITGVSGSANPLNLINPNDIENITVLKDASASAIYGSRAANGVIIITTKKGTTDNKLHVTFSTNLSSSVKVKNVAVLSADEFRAAINATKDPVQIGLMGTSNTNWQDQIYRVANSSDNNLSVSGNVGTVPFRISGGYTNQQGLLLYDKIQRYTGSLSLTPRFLNNHLKLELNGKISNSKNHFSDQGAIGSAVTFDPTQAVNDKNSPYGGYFEWVDNSGNPNTLATRNPVGLLNQREDNSNVTRYIGNAQIDYKFHFFPDLHAVINLGIDKAMGDGTVVTPATSAANFFVMGTNNSYTQTKTTKLFTAYLNYVKEIESIKSRFDLTVGHDYQDYFESNGGVNDNGAKNAAPFVPYSGGYATESFFGRFNYGYDSKYLFTATLRDDGSSKLVPEKRYVLYPSLAISWRATEEPFLRNNSLFSDLKFRLSYGTAGNQGGIGFYQYLPTFTLSQSTASYSLGGVPYLTYRPNGYNSNLTWEKTATYNAAVDFGIFGSKITGTFEYYLKKTTDLLSVVPVPAGSNLINQIITNVGSMENQGVEFVLNTVPVKTKDFSWDLSFNITYNKNTITKLTLVDDPKFQGILTGGIAGGVGNTIQINAVGSPINTYFVYQQVYDEKGLPIEAKYADLNGDGKFNADDKYKAKSAEPSIYYGITSSFKYNNLSLSFIMRGNAGNYVYNNVKSNLGTLNNIVNQRNYLSNVVSDATRTGFQNNQYFSDYYLESGTFLRMDNIILAYSFNNLLSNKMKLSVSAMVQNAFVLTGYSGLDPEISGGIDNNIYPRPRIYSLGLNASF